MQTVSGNTHTISAVLFSEAVSQWSLRNGLTARQRVCAHPVSAPLGLGIQWARPPAAAAPPDRWESRVSGSRGPCSSSPSLHVEELC